MFLAKVVKPKKSVSPKKHKKLERLYGIEHGNNQHNRTSNNCKSSKTQSDLDAENESPIQDYIKKN